MKLDKAQTKSIYTNNYESKYTDKLQAKNEL